MRILDNKKDYYDFIVGKYGMDENIIFDRRESYILERTENKVLQKYFSLAKRPDDKPIEEYRKRKFHSWFLQFLHYYDYLILEIGFTRYQFQTERYLDKEGNVHIDIIDCIRVSNCLKVARLPIAFISTTEIYERNSKTGAIINSDSGRKVFDEELLAITSNPIFEGTFIPSWIPAEQVWLDLSEYLSSLKDIKIVDNRSDIQKLESAGFDKKTSFRNM